MEDVLTEAVTFFYNSESEFEGLKNTSYFLGQARQSVCSWWCCFKSLTWILNFQRDRNVCRTGGVMLA